MSVTVLYNGSRKKVDLTSPHMPVHAILSAALDKFGLDANSKAWGLKSTRARKVLDDAAPFAHTGLSKNTEIELFQKTAKEAAAGREVRVAVAVADGGPAFSLPAAVVDAGSTLAQLVEGWAAAGLIAADAARRGPVVRVLRDKYDGAQLETTTLGGLGFGGASVRITLELNGLPGPEMPRAPAGPPVAAAPAAAALAAAPAAAAEPPRAAEVPRAAVQREVVGLASQFFGAPPPEPRSADVVMADDSREPPEKKHQPEPSSAMDVEAPTTAQANFSAGQAPAAAASREEEAARRHAAVEAAISQISCHAAAAQCARTICKYFDAILANPRDVKYRAIKRGNAAFQSRVAAVSGGEPLLAAVGFEAAMRVGEEWLELTPKGGQMDLLRASRAQLEAVCAWPPPVAALEWDPCKGFITSLARKPQGIDEAQSDTHRKLAKLRAAAAKLEGEVVSPPRQLRLTLRGQAPSAAASAADVAAAEDRSDLGLVSKAAARQAAERRKAEDAPLTTSAMREVAKLEQAAVYAAAVVRVECTGGVVLHAHFHAREQAADVYEAVRGVLSDPSRKFELYMAPPKRTVADDATTLRDAGLVPAASLHLKWAAADAPQEPKDFLNESALALLFDTGAAEAATEYPSSQRVVPKRPDEAANAPAPSAARPGARPASGAPKKPFGWLKI
ncbi:hypothetical protein M885DRAFT_588352 [Pelagophyceae sp. CCMP2097]|nr:hypothetical protein M885DRAFT_588352 [Pelagophyceae sp. CCMP2097]